MKRSILGSLVVWASVSIVFAQEVVREFSGAELKMADQLRADEIQPGRLFAQHEQAKIANAPNRQEAWWSERATIWIGAIGGPICGLLGGLLGSLGGMGKARRFVLTLTAVSAGLGVVSLIIGVVALVLGQPYAVYYPLLLFGGLSSIVCGGIFPVLRLSYQQRELWKMAAMDSR